jgi:hypothetical protein
MKMLQRFLKIKTMKKKLLFGLAFFNFVCHSQNLYITKSTTENTVLTSSILELNPNNGTILNTYSFNSIAPQLNTPSSLLFDQNNNKIISFKGNKIFKFDLNLKVDENPIEGLSNANAPYSSTVLINNRLFAYKLNNLNNFNYTATIIELSKIDGNEIGVHSWSSPFTITTNGYGITHSDATNEIFFNVGNRLLKYNIITEEESIFTLAGNDLGTHYPGIVMAENRLFVRKRDFQNNQVRNYIIELNPLNASIIASHQLTIDFQNFYSTGKLDFLANSNKIVGIFGGLIGNSDQNKILTFDISTNSENSFSLPTEVLTPTLSENYLELISTNPTVLANNNWQSKNNLGKIISVYNILGQKVKRETYNQVVIIEYENGFREKKIFIN